MEWAGWGCTGDAVATTPVALCAHSFLSRSIASTSVADSHCLPRITEQLPLGRPLLRCAGSAAKSRVLALQQKERDSA